jgi:hypothetical protein
MSMMFAMFAATRLYRAGMWASNLPFDLDW